MPFREAFKTSNSLELLYLPFSLPAKEIMLSVKAVVSLESPEVAALATKQASINTLI